MNIHIKIFLLLPVLVIQMVTGGTDKEQPAPRYKIRGESLFNYLSAKGHESGNYLEPNFTPFELCTFDDFKLQASVIVYHSLLGTSTYILRIEAIIKKIVSEYDNGVFQSYEVLAFPINPDHKEAQTKDLIKSQELCQSFKVKKITTTDDRWFFIIGYYNGHETWTCEVYAKTSFEFKEKDECSELIPDYEALADPLYNSVDTLSKDEKTSDWKPCTPKEPEDLCKIGEKFQVKSLLVCNKDGTKRYQLLTYYNRLQLGTYTITKFRTQSPQGALDGEKVCRLFRYEPQPTSSPGSENISVQFFKDVKWNCQVFKYKKGEKEGYVLQRWFGWKCKRFLRYTRP